MGLTKQQISMVTVLLIGALLVVLNQTLLTPALPTIMSHLNVSATTVQWLTSGYSLVEAVIIPLNAYFLGRFSTRKLFVGGMSLFTVGSILCASAPSFPFLMLGRICQASATGVVMPMVFALLLMIFPREKRGSAMGLIGLIVSFAPAVGPSISGVLVDSVGWRALFALVATLAILMVIVSALTLKNFEGFEKTTFDVPSVILLALGMVSLLYGLSTFISSSTIAISIALMVFGAIVLGLFAYRQMHLENPILKVDVLRYRKFAIALGVITLLEAILIGSSVIIPMFIQNALGETATVSGLLMLPGALCGAVCGLLAGRAFDRFGVRGITLAGVCVLILGIAGYFSFELHASIIMVGACYTVACIGLQTLITPINTWGMNALPNSVIPHGNALISTMEQVGGSLGTAFVVSLTALSYTTLPETAPAADHAYVGCHFAFAGMLIVAVIIGLLFLFFVRDKKSYEAAAPVLSEGIPGIDRAWLVGDVMNAMPDVLPEGATVSDAIALMQQSETSGVPIVSKQNKVLGFVSDGDILKCLSSHQNTTQYHDGTYQVLEESASLQDRLGSVLDKPVLQLATKNVITVKNNADAEKAFKTLSEKRIKKVPVVDAASGELVGTLSRRNIMKALSVMQGSIAVKH